MSSNEKQQTIEQKIAGSDYPYYYVGDKSIFMNIKLKLAKIIAPINPFAKVGVKTSDRISWSPYSDQGYYQSQPLPNPVIETNFLPVHMDVETNENEQINAFYKNSRFDLAESSLQKRYYDLPQPCNRAIFKYKQCQIVNGKEKCKQEGDNLVEICPNFALDILRKQKLKKIDNQLTQIEEYNRLMTVSDYNKGRSIKDIDLSKRKIHGTRAYLRPDSIWADERYINVTYEEILQARKELAQSGQAHDYNKIFKKEPYDWKFTNQTQGIPIYQGQQNYNKYKFI